MESASDESSASPFILLDRRLLNDEDNNLDLMQAPMEENLGFSSADINLISDLATSGLEGLSAAAAIVSMKKYSVHHSFQSDPIKRRRRKTRLLRKLRRLVQDYIYKFERHLVFMAVSPRVNVFKIFGTDTCMKAIIDMKTDIIKEFKRALDEETFYVKSPKCSPQFPLPLLTMGGLPTTIDKMTQSQLRTYIPHMIKCSTQRSKIRWGNAETKPVWWPDDLPWANIRSDGRSQKEKERVSWSDALRQIVIDCYIYHGKKRFLYSFSKNNQNKSTIYKRIAPSSSNSTAETEYQIKNGNITEQENQNQNLDVSSKDYSKCTNAGVEEDIHGSEVSTTFIKNETTIHHCVTESCERLNISGIATTENINNNGDRVEITTNVVETSFDCTTKIEEVKSDDINESPCSVLNQSDEVEYIYDDTSLVTVDANNAISLDLRGCSHGQLTYVIPLVRVQPVGMNEGEMLETFTFSQNDVATHSLVVQVNENDNLLLN